MKRMRTPSSCSSGVLPAMRVENIAIRPATSSAADTLYRRRALAPMIVAPSVGLQADL